MSDPPAVVNASPLICLTKAGLVSILGRLHGAVAVPRAVLDEIRAGPEGVRAASELEGLDWVEVVEPPAPSLALAAWDLGRGETAVLSFAVAHPSVLAILDDRAAARCARAQGLRTQGTLGTIASAKSAGVIDAVGPAMESLIRAGLWVSPALRRAMLALAGES